MDKYQAQALREYNSEAAHLGGVDGRPFWNINASQFTFAPAFQFPYIPSCAKYRFTATDKDGTAHTFDADAPTASLAPVWGDIPVGFVTLTVASVDKDGNAERLIGARTFFKTSPFPGRAALPPRARSYRDAALLSYRYIFHNDIVQHWLTHGTPKPDYAHNVYPAKMISGILLAMVDYAAMSPENAQDALHLARRAADYLLSISFPTGHPLAGLPPTYSFDGLDADEVNKVAPAAKDCVDTTMMIYPVYAGIAYLALAKATGDDKYLNAALTIADFYKENRHPAGSWYLLYDTNTGKPLKDNLCVEFRFVEFFQAIYEITQEPLWREMAEAHYRYISEVCLKNYNWEGQFEDVAVTGNYRNLTHFAANKLIGYIANYQRDDAEKVEVAKDLMRFVEDQFVLWDAVPSWLENEDGVRHTPAGLEQYLCYAPIDSS
ncbi:MAG: hypothetical protein IJF42_04675, partial [Clostridia bacterium]|nr:hypothetical protein [Clostridia bacterium]